MKRPKSLMHNIEMEDDSVAAWKEVQKQREEAVKQEAEAKAAIPKPKPAPKPKSIFDFIELD